MPDELDTIVDEAIKSYSAAEPSPDLAGRILRQAQTQGRSSGRRWKLALVFALPIAAAVALGIVLLGQWALPKPPVSIASAPSTPSLVHPQPAKTIAAAVHVPVQAHRRARKTASRRS
ncbi:MAG: hypothetical protein ACRD3F_01175, partial [Acidobacteriaceae bacterium]